MKVILLDKIRNLGDLGEQVSVKAGFARNYLFPNDKAAPATEHNIERFEERRAELERLSAEELSEAQAQAKAIEGLAVRIVAKAGEEGKLFGSLGTRDIADALAEHGVKVAKSAIQLPNGPIRQVGEYEIDINLHTDVVAVVKITVAAD